jgi:hypothetical protein
MAFVDQDHVELADTKRLRPHYHPSCGNLRRCSSPSQIRSVCARIITARVSRSR